MSQNNDSMSKPLKHYRESSDTGSMQDGMKYGNKRINMSNTHVSNNNYSQDLSPTFFADKLSKTGTMEDIKPDSAIRLNLCQWIALGFMNIILLFLFMFLVYQWKTWDVVRLNRYG